VCYIAPQAGYVNLGFFFGTHLPDPKNLLQGEGARMRHVKVKAVELARDPAIVQLVKEAWKDGPKSVEELHAKRKRK
jgi:hypothetical protein